MNKFDEQRIKKIIGEKMEKHMLKIIAKNRTDRMDKFIALQCYPEAKFVVINDEGVDCYTGK